MLRGLFVAGFIALYSAFAQASPAGYAIFISAGQSNGEGQGLGYWNDVYESAAIDAKIYQVCRWCGVLRLIPVGYTSNGKNYDGLQYYDHPVGDVRMGHMRALVRRWISKGNLKPGYLAVIIPAACGGSSIYDWTQSEHPCHGVDPYADMLTRIDFVNSLPGEKQFVLFDWPQGETDIDKAIGTPGPTADDYRNALILLIRRMRYYTGNLGLPVLLYPYTPGFASQPAGIQQTQLFTDVNRTLGDSIPHVAFVPGDGLHDNSRFGIPDGNLHWDAASQIYFADRAEPLLETLTPAKLKKAK